MRSLISLLALYALPALAGWPRVLESVGLNAGSIITLEGDSQQARAYGFCASTEFVTVRSVTDIMNPKLQIVWSEQVEVPRFETPEDATVFTRERWSGAPLAAGFRRDGKVVFWTAVPLGAKGYERFPYIPQALAELGIRPRVESRALWVFFDSSYRLRADPDYLAERWRRGGVAALHIAAWHYWEPDARRDEWLLALIEACHRHAIVVYAWVELPHVSEKFWDAHPAWREQTATGQDAQLDWRKLMNLANADCVAEIERGLRALLARFDWDGVNLSELYFESLEGYSNPARFTPFNEDVRSGFRQRAGFDPRDLFDPSSKRFHGRDARPMRRFLDYRAELAGRLQEEWLDRLAAMRETKPWLDVALTHVDDRFDSTMRDKLGADAVRLLPAASRRNASFVVEDPATIWHLGPERYEELARRYAPLVHAQPGDAANPAAELAVDLNIVERYQDVYPTKQQTGSELFQLVHAAARYFPRVALYFEDSILPADWPMLAASASPARSVKWSDGALEIDTPQSVAVDWPGCAQVNGIVWPVRDSSRLLLPAGVSRVEPCMSAGVPRILDINGNLRGLHVENGRLRVDYESRTRVYALLPGEPRRVVVLPPGRRSERIE